MGERPTVNEPTLLPCPFCGGEATPYASAWWEYGVGCSQCHACVEPGLSDKRDEVIARWNRRPEGK